jgi:glycosyltransferase 2 family protein
MTWRRWLITIISFTAAIGVSLWIIFRSWPVEDRSVGLPLLAHALCAAAVALDLILRAMKIRLSGASLGIPVTFGVAMRTGLAGDFAAAITPARTGAEPARYLVLAKARITPAGTFLLLFAELFLEMLALVIVAMGIALLFTEEPDTSLAWIVGLVGGYATFVIGVGLAGVLLAWRRSSGPPPWWARRIGLNAIRWRGIQRSLRRLRSSASLIRDARLDYFVLGLVVSVLHVLARLAVLPIIVYSLGGEAPLSKLVLWPLALFYGSIVAPVPGGGGIVEVGFKATLGGVIPVALFGASLVWWRFYTFYLYILLGALAAGGTVLRALRSAEENGTANGLPAESTPSEPHTAHAIDREVADQLP